LRSVQAELQGLLSVLRNDLEVKTAGLQERRTFLQSRLTDVETRLNADVEARNAAAERRTKIEQGLTALVRLSGQVEKHSAALDARQNELQEARRRQSDEVRAISQRLDEARKERNASETALEERRERNRRVEVEEAEVRMRLEATIEALRRDHSVEPQLAVDSPMPELPENTSPITKVRELERELRLMGPINPLALEEFDELQKRHTFLEEQLEDVKNTRRELIKVIKQVDMEIQSTFASAYSDVRDNFEKLFGGLFPGGQGKLILTSPDDLLNTGIEVEAKPSGKNVKKLSLLSGGERSLTALAFLFAVFRSRPSPFYVMDEVEAALDDVNLHRFLTLIDEFRKDAQLLIVSHQKRTMEAGDCLLGVTMQPGGSSRVIVERAATTSA
jgi:chromosome segregation protein